MGNTCQCDGSSQQDSNLEAMGGDATPRLQLKPEKLPFLTQAVKSQNNKLKTETAAANVQINNNENRLVNNIQKKETKLMINNAALRASLHIDQPPPQSNASQIPASSNLQNGGQNGPNTQHQQQQQQDNKINQASAVQYKTEQPYMMKSVEKGISQKEESKEPSKPLTLYDKLGGEAGIQAFSDKVLDKAVADPTLAPFFKNHNMQLLKEKFKYYIGFISGGHQFWIGQSMADAHKHMIISDQTFDQFISLCVQALKEMRVKHDCLKEAVRTLQGLRDNIVKKPEEVIQKTFFEEIGGIDKMKEISKRAMEKVVTDIKLCQYFQYADLNIHEKRFAYYLAYITGGQKEWLGRTLQQAHKGRLIQAEHFDTFIKYVSESLTECKVSKQHSDKLMADLKKLKQDIVEDQSELTLFEKLDANNRFEPVMTNFIDKLMKDKYLGQYFTNNKMKHCITNKIVLFFAYSKGILSTDDMKSMKEYHKNLRLNPLDFEKSIILFRDALYENNIDPALVEETLNFYKTMRKDLVHTQDESKINVELEQAYHQLNQQQNNPNLLKCPIKHGATLQAENNGVNQKKESEKMISSFKIESQPSQNQDSSNIMSIQNEVEKINQQIEEEVQRIQLENDIKNIDAEQQHNNEEKQQPNNMQIINNEENDEIELKVQSTEKMIASNNNVLLGDNNEKEIIEEVNKQLEKIEKSIIQQESRQVSPLRSKRPQQHQFKYQFLDLLNENMQYEGQLNRYMDKQKTQLPRWLILRQNSLFIYKDQMNSKSFPQKPLYCIPLKEIKDVNMQEQQIHPNQRKNQAIQTLEITLKDCYGVIASSIAQLGSTVIMAGALNQQQGFNKHNPKSQNHDFNDSVLIFVSQSKKDTYNWVRRIKINLGWEMAPLKQNEKDTIQQSEIKQQPQVKETLYVRIGGEPAIQALVDGMYQKIFNDPELTDFFKKTNKEHQKQMQFRFLTYATGGSTEYNGKSMKEAHQGRGIGVKEFNLVAGHVVSTLHELNVNQLLIDEVVELLSTLKGEVQDEQSEEEIKTSNQQLQQHQQSLYDRVGGEKAIDALVEGMYAKIFTDPQLKDFFSKTDKEQQKKMQKLFLTYLTGGNPEWNGKSMMDAHKGRGIRGNDFDRVALHIVTTLQDLKVSQSHINEIVSLLLQFKKQICDEASPKSSKQSKPSKPLFERLGGADAIKAVVDLMYVKILADETLSDFFKKTNMDKQKESQRLFLTYATGGSKEWNGKSMHESHKGRGIEIDHFNKVIQHVANSMQELNVNTELINETKDLLQTLQNDILKD